MMYYNNPDESTNGEYLFAKQGYIFEGVLELIVMWPALALIGDLEARFVKIILVKTNPT